MSVLRIYSIVKCPKSIDFQNFRYYPNESFEKTYQKKRNQNDYSSISKRSMKHNHF
jgi:hypothetical protein